MAFMSLGIGLHAQDWSEEYLLNSSNSFSFNTQALLPSVIVLEDVDPAIGTASAEFENGKLYVDFDPVQGAVGETELIIEYFPGPWPNFAPATLAWRFFVDSSHVRTIADYAVVLQDSTIEIDVLANDTSVGGGPLELLAVPSEENGVGNVSLDDQTVVFTPAPGFSGLAYLTYVAIDSLGATSAEKVTICVQSGEPLVTVDTIDLATDSRTPIPVFMPATGFVPDPDNSPDHGELESVTPEVFLYTPETDYNGTDEFIMTMDPDYAWLVRIRVFEQDAPNDFLIPDEYYTRVDSAITFDVRLNDLKQSYNIHSYTEPARGDLTFDEATNLFTYEPDPGYSGVQEFVYSMSLLGKYEETTVKLIVGHLAPVNTETYSLNTHINVPIVINYEIPLENYDMYHTDGNPASINLSAPDNGLLSFEDGWHSIDVLCDEITGYDMIKYTPDEGYVGTDYFEIVYCVQPDECTLVKINIEVSDFGELGPCPCVDGCVWPGDADANGIVNMTDLLSVGWNIGETGSPRNYSDNSVWFGQHADDWEMLGEAPVNAKNNDCNGDGIVSTDDLGAIATHFLKAHTLVPNVPGLKTEVPLYLVPQETVLDSGDLAVIDIYVGDENFPVFDMHGFYFALNLPEDLVDSSSLTVTFEEDTWLSHAGPSMQLDVQPWDGRVDAGFTRVDGVPASGAGFIGTMTFIIEDDIEGIAPPGTIIPIELEVIGAGASDSKGVLRDVEGENPTLYFRVPGERGIGWRSAEEDLSGQLYVYPNPASEGSLNLHFNGDSPIREVAVYDIAGQTLLVRNSDTRKMQLDISNFATGMYFVQVHTSDGIINKKFEVINHE